MTYVPTFVHSYEFLTCYIAGYNFIQIDNEYTTANDFLDNDRFDKKRITQFETHLKEFSLDRS